MNYEFIVFTRQFSQKIDIYIVAELLTMNYEMHCVLLFAIWAII